MRGRGTGGNTVTREVSHYQNKTGSTCQAQQHGLHSEQREHRAQGQE